MIVELAPALVGALTPGSPGRLGGRLIVSGVIEEREHEVRAAIGAAGGRIESARAMGDWRCIEAMRA